MDRTNCLHLPTTLATGLDIDLEAAGKKLRPTIVLAGAATLLRKDKLDWQVFVDVDSNLPKIIVLTSKMVTGSPQYRVFMKATERNKAIADSQFDFVAPDGMSQTFRQVGRFFTPYNTARKCSIPGVGVAQPHEIADIIRVTDD